MDRWFPGLDIVVRCAFGQGGAAHWSRRGEHDCLCELLYQTTGILWHGRAGALVEGAEIVSNERDRVKRVTMVGMHSRSAVG